MKTTQVAFRFDNTLIDRLDAFALVMTKATHISCNRADAARLLIDTALEAAEKGTAVKVPAIYQSPEPKAPKAPKAKP